jgi:hypothetical protein
MSGPDTPVDRSESGRKSAITLRPLPGDWEGKRRGRANNVRRGKDPRRGRKKDPCWWWGSFLTKGKKIPGSLGESAPGGRSQVRTLFSTGRDTLCDGKNTGNLIPPVPGSLRHPASHQTRRRPHQVQGHCPWWAWRSLFRPEGDELRFVGRQVRTIQEVDAIGDRREDCVEAFGDGARLAGEIDDQSLAADACCLA